MQMQLMQAEGVAKPHCTVAATAAACPLDFHALPRFSRSPTTSRSPRYFFSLNNWLPACRERSTMCCSTAGSVLLRFTPKDACMAAICSVLGTVGSTAAAAPMMAVRDGASLWTSPALLR